MAALQMQTQNQILPMHTNRNITATYESAYQLTNWDARNDWEEGIEAQYFAFSHQPSSMLQKRTLVQIAAPSLLNNTCSAKLLSSTIEIKHLLNKDQSYIQQLNDDNNKPSSLKEDEE